MAEDDGLLPPGLALEGENDDDTRADAAAMFGFDLGDGSATPTPIDLDDDGGEGATATVNSNGFVPSVAGNGNTGKCKSPVWADFEEIFEDVNGVKICTKAICKMCKSTLSPRSTAGTGHLKRHKKSCRLKIINVLGFNLDIFTILIVLCITKTINVMLLDLNYVV
jgi:hypothetical protein